MYIDQRRIDERPCWDSKILLRNDAASQANRADVRLVHAQTVC